MTGFPFFLIFVYRISATHRPDFKSSLDVCQIPVWLIGNELGTIHAGVCLKHFFPVPVVFRYFSATIILICMYILLALYRLTLF